MGFFLVLIIQISKIAKSYPRTRSTTLCYRVSTTPY